MIQVLIGGLLLGWLYALVAFGLSLIYGVVRILNFSHGTLLSVGGVLASLLYATYKLHPVFLILILVPAFFAFGYFFYAYLLQPLERRSHFESTVGTVLVTVGALLIRGDRDLHHADLDPRRDRGAYGGHAGVSAQDMVRAGDPCRDPGPGGRANLRCG
ncbi:MAG: hypothetical protein NT176_16935 [Proteobacteria bacterium]|nr:hypothetical protein [Pseudomonadota bacterium]